MANLKEIRNRINSVSSTMQITNAMKMVSAAKLNKAQERITAMRPYADKLTELLQSLSASSDGDNSPYAEIREENKILVVAISSNRGLAGAFNSNIIKRVNYLVQTEYADSEVEVFTIGKKANDVLKKTVNITRTNTAIYDKMAFEDIADIAGEIMASYVDKKYDKVIFVYNRFINAATQEVMSEQFLPIVADEETEEAIDEETFYIYEPKKEKIVTELIPKSLKIQLYKALCDSFASEHGARMTAMHKATDNATELKNELTLSYNKARQAAITNEILEIVGGAEALNN